jgi:hypothetical protein
MTALLDFQERREQRTGRYARLLNRLSVLNSKLYTEKRLADCDVVMAAHQTIMLIEIELNQAIAEKNRRPFVEKL